LCPRFVMNRLVGTDLNLVRAIVQLVDRLPHDTYLIIEALIDGAPRCDIGDHALNLASGCVKGLHRPLRCCTTAGTMTGSHGITPASCASRRDYVRFLAWPQALGLERSATYAKPGRRRTSKSRTRRDETLA